MENGLITMGIFLDLAKVFDTINHQILLTKLHRYGISGNVHSWFVSYLLDRQQYTEYGGAKSSFLVIQHGTLVSLLFSIYIDNFQYRFEKLELMMYAENINVFIKERISKTHCPSTK